MCLFGGNGYDIFIVDVIGVFFLCVKELLCELEWVKFFGICCVNYEMKGCFDGCKES